MTWSIQAISLTTASGNIMLKDSGGGDDNSKTIKNTKNILLAYMLKLIVKKHNN